MIPVGPVTPVGPNGPVEPVLEAFPSAPVGPVGPVAPVSPFPTEYTSIVAGPNQLFVLSMRFDRSERGAAIIVKLLILLLLSLTLRTI